MHADDIGPVAGFGGGPPDTEQKKQTNKQTNKHPKGQNKDTHPTRTQEKGTTLTFT